MCIDCLYAEFAPDPWREYQGVEADMIFVAMTPYGEVEVDAVLAWDEEDPYAITATLSGKEHTWMFDRELLAEGLHHPAGIGDVRFRPSAHDPHRGVMVLDSPKGYTQLSFDLIEMTFFLAAIDKRLRAAGRSDAH
jgi:hypothetical protein